MKGWMAFWAALIAIALASGFTETNFGEEAQTWVVGILSGLLLIGVLMARASHKAQVQGWVDELVAHHRDTEDQGAYGEWFEKNSTKDADRYRVAEAARTVLRAYGGRHVINELVNEGHQHVLYDDLADVFGDHRAGQIMVEVFALANQPGFMAHLAAFGLGVFLGHKATARR